MKYSKPYIPMYYNSKVRFVQEFQEKLHKYFPYEQVPDTPFLERTFKELDEDIMNACLAETLKKNIRYVPNQNKNARYLYSILRNQVRGKQGDPGVFKKGQTSCPS